jgi:hypothetical protein
MEANEKLEVKLPQTQKTEDQWNRVENPGMNSHSYAHLIFDKVTKNI